MDNSIIPYLFMITFILVLGVGVWQIFKVRKARAEHQRSAQAEALHEPKLTGESRTR